MILAAIEPKFCYMIQGTFNEDGQCLLLIRLAR